MPPPDYAVDGVDMKTVKGAEGDDLTLDLSVSDSILSWDFLLIYLTFAGNELCGLLVISKIQTIATHQFGRSSADAVFANAVLREPQITNPSSPQLGKGQVMAVPERVEKFRK